MSEIKTLEIPKWGLSMEEGTIAQWLIQEGDSFSKGQEICEIETTKIVNVLEAPFGSTLRKIIAKDGDTLPVGGLIAVCAESSVSDAEIEQFVQSLGGAAVSAAPVAQAETVVTTTAPQAEVAAPSVAVATTAAPVAKAPATTQTGFVIPAALQGYQQDTAIFATPHALKLAAKHNVNLAKVSGSGREGRISVQDIQTAVRAAGGQWADIKHQASGKPYKSNVDDSQVLATPVARRLAKQWGINLHDCRVSGSRGRVCKEDVEALYYRDNPSTVCAESAATSADATPKSQVTSIALNAMRKAIASRLQAAKRNAPHFRLTVDLNVEAMQNLRKQINDSVPQVKLSINDMLI